MTSLSALNDWNDTRNTLHRVVQIISTIRSSLGNPKPNDAHTTMMLTPYGLTTGIIDGVGEIALDFDTGSIRYQPLEEDAIVIPINGHDQRSIIITLIKKLQIDQPLNLLFRTDQLFLMELNSEHAVNYLQVLVRVTEIFELLRERLPGTTTDALVWPNAFDLSFFWFGNSAPDHNTQPHIIFGFTPGTANMPEPYFYVQPWPLPPGLTGESLPPAAIWHTEGWTGVMVDYDMIIREEQPEIVACEILTEIFQMMLPYFQS